MIWTKPLAIAFAAAFFLQAGALAQTPPPTSPDMPGAAMTEELLARSDELADVDAIPAAGPRELPPGVIRVRNEDGSYNPPFEEREICNGDICRTSVVNSQTGDVLRAFKLWRDNVMATGYGEEVVMMDTE